MTDERRKDRVRRLMSARERLKLKEKPPADIYAMIETLEKRLSAIEKYLLI